MTQTLFEIKALFIQFSIDPTLSVFQEDNFLYFGFLYFYVQLSITKQWSQILFDSKLKSSYVVGDNENLRQAKMFK